MRVRRSLLPAILLFSSLALCRPADAYSVLTHEQLIDLTWQSAIVPLLLSRYPTLTHDQLEHARAYAYGGCVIQDIGYYPFGDQFFSDLTHYVRSGDFVVNLFRNAGDADELAFAIGALSHYIGDSVGHSEATNLSVPVEFPKLEARYGPVVNYAEGAHQHVQTEFAFDISRSAANAWRRFTICGTWGWRCRSGRCRWPFTRPTGCERISASIGRRASTWGATGLRCGDLFPALLTR